MNGVGKSTLFKIISNEIKCDCKKESEFKNIFHLAQNTFCPRGITLFDYLSGVFFKKGFNWFLNPSDVQKIDNALKQAGLFNKKELFVENLSGGEFQKLNLALALLFDPDLLLLDEPGSNLDIINQKQVSETVKNLNTTTVVILHDLNTAAQIGDSFIGIDKNHKIIQTDKENFFTPDNLKRIFGIDFKIIKDDEKYFIQS